MPFRYGGAGTPEPISARPHNSTPGASELADGELSPPSEYWKAIPKKGVGNNHADAHAQGDTKTLLAGAPGNAESGGGEQSAVKVHHGHIAPGPNRKPYQASSSWR